MIIEPNNVTPTSGLRPAHEVFKSLNLPKETMGRALRTWRKCEELTLATVAQKLGISKQLLSAYEHDKKSPSIQRIIEIAKILDVDPIIFLTFRLQDEITACGYGIASLELYPLETTDANFSIAS
jgi:transcriptional regulator with XRE-family HTH domain